MKKTISLLLAIAVLTLALSGCIAHIATDVESTLSEVSTPDTAQPDTAPDTTAPTEQVPDTDADTPDDTQTPVVPDEATPDPVDMNIAVLKGPTGMGMAKLMADAKNDLNGEVANNYNFTVDSDTSAVLAKLIAGDYDIAALPTNTAAVAYSKTQGGIQMLALNTMGTLYLLENSALESPAVTSVEDLRGATITTFGQGANPEYVLTYVLEAAGLTVGEDVTIEFCAAVDEVLARVAAGECQYAMLPEPNASVAQAKNTDFTVALDMNEAWEQASGGQTQLVMGCLAIRAEFAEAHPENVARFLEEYRASVEYICSADDAAAIIAAEEIVPSEAVAAKALPNANLCCITGDAMQQTVEGYYNVLFNFNPQAVGGSVPDAAFYYLGE